MSTVSPKHSFPPGSTQIRRQSIYEEVIEQIKRYIVANHLVPGDRLPTEAALAQQFGVSRLTVREAVKVLESLGVVQSRTRDGMRLRAITFKPVADHLRFLMDVNEVTAQEMAAARQVLECSILPLVVQNATAEDLDDLQATLDAMEFASRETPVSPEAVTDADMQFHILLLRATRNRALEGFGVMLQEFFHQVRGDVLARSGQVQRSLADHRAIVDAIRQRDADAAQETMRRHLGVYDAYPFAPLTVETGNDTADR